MKRVLQKLFGRDPGGQLEFYVRAYNVLAAAGVLVSLFSAVISLAIGDPPGVAALYMAFCLLSVGLLYYSVKTGRYQRCSFVTIIVIFLIGFPLFFWVGGGNYGAMPYFFVFAVVFTVFMQKGRAAVLTVLLELAVYTGACVCAHFFYLPQQRYLESESIMIETIFGFLVVGIALGATMYIQIRLYNRQQQVLAGQNAKLDRINRMKTELLGNVSHELKTPLTVISGYAQESRKKLSGNPEMADIERSMKLIASEADRLALMVSQVLDATRIDEGRMNFDFRPAPLSQILQNTLRTYYPVFGKNNNALELERGGDCPVVLCDPPKIEQVLVNLISNAARHTHDGKITIGVKESGGFATVSITDTGEGIPDEHKADLFERYKSYTGDSDGRRAGRETGTGLGLFICRHIISEHGGRITVESAPGKGTTVRFTLPVQS